MLLQECVPHICKNCQLITKYFFSIDLKYQIEEPFLCSEQCYEEYAIKNLVDDTQSDEEEHDETHEFDGNRINPPST